MGQELGNIRGRKVISADAHEIGEVEDIVVDTQGWRVESLELKVSKDVADSIGVDRGIIHGGKLSLPVDMVQSVGDSILLKVPSTELRRSAAVRDAAAGR